VHRQLKAELLGFARSHRRPLLQSSAAALAVCIVPLVLGSPGYVTGSVHGVMLTAMIAIFGLAFLFHGKGALLLAASYAEAYTQEEIALAAEAGSVWGAVHNIELGKLDIDHLVLAPAGVFALETKWRFDTADPAWLQWAADQARVRARKAASVLRSADVRHRAEVDPVLVVWGGAMRKLPEHYVHEGVPVVRGDALAAWLQGCGRGPLAQDHAEELHGKLVAFAETRARHAVA
jgi:hypothetical protein